MSYANRRDFSMPDPPLFNTILVIEGKKLYVNREVSIFYLIEYAYQTFKILCTHSPVFRAMLMGDFPEAHQAEVTLTEPKKYRDFLNLLRIFYQEEFRDDGNFFSPIKKNL